MGEAYLLKRGGSGTAAITVSDYAMICARVPAGCNCVCAKGGEMMKAENVPSIASFAVPSDGGWSVTISDGTRSRSGLVSISGAGEVRAIQIAYPTDVSPVESGILFSPQTGLKNGIILQGGAALSGGTILESGSGGFWLSPAIDLTSYAHLIVTGYLREDGGGQSRICLGSTSARVFDPAQTPNMTAVWMGGVNRLYTAALSIATLSGSYYIGSTAVGNHLEIVSITLA